LKRLGQLAGEQRDLLFMASRVNWRTCAATRPLYRSAPLRLLAGFSTSCHAIPPRRGRCCDVSILLGASPRLRKRGRPERPPRSPLAFPRPNGERRPMTRAEAPAAIFDPFSLEFRDDPYPSYRAMRDAGPVIRTPFGLLMVTRYEPADRILRS